MLREPVSRAISFFAYQKVRLRFPADYPIADYLAAADRSTDADFLDPENEKYMAFRGGCYADFLPAWLDTFGTDRVHVIDFEHLVADQAGTLRPARRRGSASTRTRFPADALSSENRTTGFKSKSFQGFALAANDRLEKAAPAPSRGQAQAAGLLLPAERHRPSPRSVPDVGAGRARRALPRSRTRGSPTQLDAAGIAAPRVALRASTPSTAETARHCGFVDAVPRLDGDRAARSSRAGTSTKYTRAHSNTTAISAGIAIPESLSA